MIVLLTDFQEYANVMKGVMKSLNPDIEFMDLNNNIEHFNIIQGAWKLYSFYHYFPKGTIFLCVVDPGVGSERKGLIIHTRNYVFIGPDNGLMYSAAVDDGIFRIFEIDNNKAKVLAKGIFHRKYKISKTFHGRDIFGLVAASLENKYTLDFMGKITDIDVKLDLRPVKDKGIIVDIDNYGNIITNIYDDKLGKLIEDSEKRVKQKKSPNKIIVKFRKSNTKSSSHNKKTSSNRESEKTINLYTYYDLAKNKEIFGLINSQGVLELAKKQDSVNKELKLSIGDKIRISYK